MDFRVVGKLFSFMNTNIFVFATIQLIIYLQVNNFVLATAKGHRERRLLLVRVLSYLTLTLRILMHNVMSKLIT